MYQTVLTLMLAVPLLALASPHNRLAGRAAATTVGIGITSPFTMNADPATSLAPLFNVSIGAAGSSLGGPGEPPSEWNKALIKSTNFDFSGDWLAVYFTGFIGSITIDKSCVPDRITGLCDIEEPISDRNMSWSLGDRRLVIRNPSVETLVHVDASAGLQSNTATGKPFEPVYVSQTFGVNIQDAVILYRLDAINEPIFAGFDHAVITTAPFQTKSEWKSSSPVQHKTVVDIAFRPTYDWIITDTSFAAVAAVEIPRISLTLTPIANGTDTCSDITKDSKLVFDNLTRVESTVTVGGAIVDENGKTKQRVDEVMNETQPSQCYSYDAAQERLVAPTGGRQPKPEDIAEKSNEASVVKSNEDGVEKSTGDGVAKTKEDGIERSKEDGAGSLSVASSLIAAIAVSLGASLL